MRRFRYQVSLILALCCSFGCNRAGDEILCEANSLEDAYDIMYGYYEFKEEELKYVEEMSVEEGEWLGLDTY